MLQNPEISKLESTPLGTNWFIEEKD